MHIDPNLYQGRPADCTGRLDREIACYDLLDALGISYTRADHDAADTIADCHAIEGLLGAAICKNLVLCNRQKTDFYLLLMEGDKPFRTKDLSKQIGSSRLSFAAPEDMEQYLGVTPGSATILSLMNDKEHRVKLILDKSIAGGPLWLPSLHQYLDPEPLHAGDAGQVFAPSGHRADARRPARRAGGD